MFFYQAHGLSIQSSIQLPELLKNEINVLKSDVNIKYGYIDHSSLEVLSEGIFRIASSFVKTPNSIYYLWNNKLICKVSHGKEIIINVDNEIEENYLRTLILGPAFGILLHQRGRLVLHASAVNFHNGAVAFMGDNGIGKSTTTIAFSYYGYPIVADDILSIEFDNNMIPHVFSSFPRIKLWPETLKFFHENLDDFTKIHSESEKRSCYIDDFTSIKIPLKWIYVIEKGDNIYINSLTPSDAFIKLIKNSYCSNIFTNSEEVDILNNYANIVKNVDIKILNVENSLEKLSELVKNIEKDISNSGID